MQKYDIYFIYPKNECKSFALTDAKIYTYFIYKEGQPLQAALSYLRCAIK